MERGEKGQKRPLWESGTTHGDIRMERSYLYPTHTETTLEDVEYNVKFRTWEILMHDETKDESGTTKI